jgi:hypothetical protein
VYGGTGGASIQFGATNLDMPMNYSECTFLVKYDTTGAVLWAQLIGGSAEAYSTKVALDAGGNVYLRGCLVSKSLPGASITIGNSNLVLSTGSERNMFIAKFDNSGALIWVQHPEGGNVDAGGVAVDDAGNVYVTGWFGGTLNFGNGISLTGSGTTNAFVAKYSSAGATKWATKAGTSFSVYMDVALDAQTNVYAAGCLNSNAAVVMYDPEGHARWTNSASGATGNPVGSCVTKCAVDSAGDCYLAGVYQTTMTFGTNILKTRETANFFLAEVVGPLPPVTVTASNYPADAGKITGGGTKTNGATVTLHATNNAGAVFESWTVGASIVATTNPFVFTATSNETVVANFDWVVTTKVSPANAGTATGAGDYANGADVTITAAATNAWYYFTNWTKSGKVVGTNTAYVITNLTNGETLTANFELFKYAVKTATNIAKAGKTTGAGNYVAGTKATVTATAATGYKFEYWSEGELYVTNKADYTFTVTGNETLTANFEDVSVPAIDITPPAHGGEVGASLLAITGTAGNVLDVSSVVVKLGTNEVPVSSTNQWTNWWCGVLLAPGTNVISAYALSEVGTPSKTNTITVIDTNTGLAPASLAGLIGQAESSVDGSLVISFGEATLEHFSLEPGHGAGAGNYTYTQTGPDTATLVIGDFLPPDMAANGVSTNYLTFTSPSTANTTNSDATKTGTVTFAPGQGLDVSSRAGYTYYSTDISSNTSVNTFGDATFALTNGDGTAVSGAYTSMQYGPMAVLIMMTNADIHDGGVSTNYSFTLFSSPTNAQWFITSYNGIGGGPFFDSGTATGVYHPTGEKYVAPEALNGMSVEVTAETPERLTYNETYGQATYGQTTSSTNIGSRVWNYTYTRTGANTAVEYNNEYLPGLSGGSDVTFVTFQSSDSATWTNFNSGGESTGKVSFSFLPQTGYYAPAALNEGNVVLDFATGANNMTNKVTIACDYGGFTNLGIGQYGTYTYTVFSPTVAMLVQTDMDAGDLGHMVDIQLTFTNSTAGTFYGTKPSDGSVKIGSFKLTK